MIAMISRFVLTALDDIKNVTGGVISGVSRRAPLSDERRYNIALIMNELLANSFEHARPTPANPVFVQAELSGDVLRIGVTDGGAGFDYLEQNEEAPDDAALFQERGRGLRLVRALCSDICYNDAGNSVVVSIAL